ncbi:hypothetical protein AAV99_00145 [Aurantiacibacter marinus]|uniref:alpha-L-rhamnosidase n=1 Tax=Aurantiacibacter marinus TaxID=874156 RepID=A0A0H0XXP5_9SPHN|nr:hypothetical protein AAV99_00145 [Aurantiacibacter marinus]
MQAGSPVTSAATIAPLHLQVENQLVPRAVDRTSPRLSWRSPVTAQDAYQIEVASTAGRLTAGEADLWNSGKVSDGRSLAIPYAGAPLASRQQAFWRVRIWADGADAPGAWSETASWNMALLEQTDWQARWITSPLFDPAESTPGLERWLAATANDPQFRDPATVADTFGRLRAMRPATYFRRDFTVDRPVRSAMLYSTSAGYSEFFLSGEKIGDRILNPAQTDFDKRIYYDVDDLTDRLGMGEHTLAIHLGNGFYAERTAFGLDRLFYGEPAAIAQLEIEYEDGSREVIISDESWQAHPSPILKNGVYSGEVFDARAQLSGWTTPAGASSADWVPAAVFADAPTQQLVAAEMPPVRRVTEVTPQAVLNPATGVWTIDFGQNFTGIPTIDFSQLNLEPGQTVIFRYAEWADDTGQVGMNSGGGAPRTKQVDAYVSDGVDAQPWSPSFTWHGFRYMEVTGLSGPPPINAFTAHLTRTDVDRIGHFQSSSELLNRIHETALWSFETNLVSVPSDCPIRERNGWTGDAHATVNMASYNFDMAPFLEKYLGDFETTDQIAPTIVPGRRTRSGMIDWAAAEVFLAWEHYLHSGDLSVIEGQYESLLEYVAYVETVADGDLFTDDTHFYGDWCDTLPAVGAARPLGRCMSVSTPGEVTATALIARVYDQMADMAALTARNDDAEAFTARRDAIRNAFNAAYYDAAAGSYGSQTANAMAISFGIAPDSELERVSAAIEHDVRVTWGGHASVGALGQTWLYPALSDHGHADTAFAIFTAPGAPGYSYLFDTLGGTTLWEDNMQYVPEDGAEPGKSLNHPFKGGYDAWFYSGLGGINPDPDNPGYKHFRLSPVFPADLDEAIVSLETGYGLIRSEWARTDDTIGWEVEVPFNTQATVRLGVNDIAARRIGPGTYHFTLSQAGDRIVSVERE